MIIIFSFFNREHCQQPDYDSSSDLWRLPDVSWRPGVSLHLLIPRTGGLVCLLSVSPGSNACIMQLFATASLVRQHLPPLLFVTLRICENIMTSKVSFGVCRPAVGVGSWCFHMTLLYEMQVGYIAALKHKYVSKTVLAFNSSLDTVRQIYIMYNAKSCWDTATLPWWNECALSSCFCSYWMSCQWSTAHVSLSTVCK